MNLAVCVCSFCVVCVVCVCVCVWRWVHVVECGCMWWRLVHCAFRCVPKKKCMFVRTILQLIGTLCVTVLGTNEYTACDRYAIHEYIVHARFGHMSTHCTRF